MNGNEQRFSAMRVGSIVGLLTFACSVPIGAVSGLEPETILWRAVSGSVVAGIVVAVTAGGLRLALAATDDD